jgi:hypothetical protein
MERSLVVLPVAAALSAAGPVQPACAPVLVELCAAEVAPVA